MSRQLSLAVVPDFVTVPVNFPRARFALPLGKRVFDDDGALRPLRLVEHKLTTTGAILATYATVKS